MRCQMVYILSFDIKSLNFMTDGYVKKSSRERFFQGIAWLRDLSIKAQWYEDFRPILVCGSTSYVKEVWKVLLARSKCERKKEIACKFTLTLVYVPFESTREERTITVPGRNSLKLKTLIPTEDCRLVRVVISRI